MQALRPLALATALLAAAPGTQAALVDRGGGLIYDTTRNITWLADMNLNGPMTWNAANAWANNLVYGGFDDWRLPTLNPADTTCSGSFNAGGGFPNQHIGTGCTGGELSHLFVADLGNKAYESVLNQTGDTAEQIANLALFSNVQSGHYWSGTAYAPNTFNAWYFRSSNGFQFADDKIDALYAVAVRDGDVAAAAAVPEPQTLALALAALGAAFFARRRA